jgi:hypothetical protein
MDFDFEAEKRKWRDSGEDFETLAIKSTADPGTFTRQKSFAMPIFTSCVFVPRSSAGVEREESVRSPCMKYLRPTSCKSDH